MNDNFFQATFLITSTLDTQMFDRFRHFVKDKPTNVRTRVHTCGNISTTVLKISDTPSILYHL